MKGPIQVQCAHCGKLFLKTWAETQRTERAKKRHFCSLSCSASSQPSRAKQHGELSAELYKNTRNRAHRAKIPFSITPLDVEDMLIKAGNRCELSGIRFLLDTGTREKKNPWRPSIDRKDSALGYTKDNCRLVCVAANLALNNWGDAVLLKLAHGVVAQNGRV